MLSLETMVGFRGQRSTKTPARMPRTAMGSMYAIWTPVTCWAVAWSLKVRMEMTAKSARKSPKTEMIWAYQSRRIMGMRMTSPMESGAGSSGSMTGLGIDSAGAGLGEVVLMRGEFMVLDRRAKFTPGREKPEQIS
jgi:hypothetical protein